MEKEILTNNILIAEFIGFKKNGYLWHAPVQYLNIYPKAIFVGDNTNSFRFHKSWDWLAPAIIKISHLKGPFRISIGNVATYCKVEDVPLNIKDNSNTDPLTAVYNSVIDFIKWHNQQENNGN